MASKYFDTAFGTAVYPHFNKPDGKFNPDNPMFKGGLRLEGEAAAKLKAKVDAEVDAYFEEYFTNGEGKSATAGERKKFEKYYPYEVEEDDEGEPTGAIVFEFKQNATIKMRDGTTKTVKIGIYDAAGKAIPDVIVRGGSVVRINASIRGIGMKGLKKVGVRLDFGRVQVKELAQGNGGGFGAVDGYEHEEGSGGFGDTTSGGGSVSSGEDY